MYRTIARFRPLAQLIGVLACTGLVFQFGVYVWMNCPNVARQRMDRENADVVERVQSIYAANDWPGLPADTLDANDANDANDAAAAPDADRHTAADPDTVTDPAATTGGTSLAVATPDPVDADCLCAGSTP